MQEKQMIWKNWQSSWEKYEKGKTKVSKAVINISGLLNGGLRLKSPFRTGFLHTFFS
jgi:hypothetical protein